MSEDIVAELKEVIARLPCPGWAHAPHPADVIVVARGRSLEEAFEQAAIGVYEIVTDTSRVEPREERRIEEEGDDLEQLLYRWIESLLYYTDSEGLVFSRFKVESIEPREDGGFTLRARAWGEPMDPSRHPPRTTVKAVTYSMMEVVRENGCWRVQFVVDI